MAQTPNPLVSIITPTYNHEQFISACIGSVRRQTYPHWEHIIVDDGSSDRTAEIIAQFADPRLRYSRQQRRGLEELAHTYNAALKMANGELVAILEGDDFWPPDKLSSLVPAFEDERIVLAYGAVADVSGNGVWRGRLARSVRRRMTLDSKVLRNDPIGSATHYMLRSDGVDLIPPSTVIVRRAALQAIGGFQYVSGLWVTDYPTFLQLSLAGTFYYTSQIMGFRRRHAGSATFENLAAITAAAEAHASEFQEHCGLEFSSGQRRGIGRTWRLAGYEREFTAGRLQLAKGNWKLARAHFLHALHPLCPRALAASAVGWMLSWLHCDLEWLMRLAGLADIHTNHAKP